MAWIYFQELEEFPSPCETMSNQSLIAKLNHFVKECSYLECTQENFPELEYGMTLRLSHQFPYFIKPSISSTAAAHVRISVLQEMEKAWKESEVDCFSRSLGCVATLNQDLYFWKTCPQLPHEGEQQWLGKLPRWGMTVAGALYQLRPLEHYIEEKGGSYWPTPQARAQTDTPSERKRHTPCLHTAVLLKKQKDSIGHLNPESIGKKLCPKWVSVLMGYPTWWTDCEDWVMQSFPNKQEKRLKS